MRKVRDRLYIGNITDANSVLHGTYPEVTHLLSLLSTHLLRQENPRPGDPYSLVTVSTGPHVKPLIEQMTANQFAAFFASSRAKGSKHADAETEADHKVVRMAVPLNDTESENLLVHLEACVDFIDKGRKNGAVLVHCLAGVSRSASVTLAYLMRTERLDVEAALTSLRKSSEMVCPNTGFMDQLQMYEEMGFKVDHGSSIYKKFRTSKLGDAYGKGGKIEWSKFALDPGAAVISSGDDDCGTQVKPSEEKRASLYRCKKCRRLVACESNVLTHDLGMGKSSFKSKRKGSGRDVDDDQGELKCSSIFVEPMQWMTAVAEGQVEGKLACATCEARLGYYNWAGLQCSCGAWINPAFQLHKSRLDLTWL